MDDKPKKELSDEELVMIVGGLWPFAINQADVPISSKEKED